MTETADVVVIGGGIVGCSAAYHLAAAGTGRVVLLEREAGVGRGATGACAGGFRLQFTSEINIRLSLASVPMILGFEQEHGIPVDVTQDGYLFLVRDPATWRGFGRGVELQRSLGVPVDVLDAAGVTRLVPDLALDDLVGATFGPADGIADPGALTQGYATLARAAGAEMRLGANVETIRSTHGRVAGVRAEGSEIAAGAVVLAAGPWSGVLAASAGIDLTDRAGPPRRPDHGRVPRPPVATHAGDRRGELVLLPPGR